MLLVIAAAAGIMATLLPATAASAHSQLLHTAPADGATVRTPVSSVVLTFNEMVKQRFTTVVITGPDGRTYSRGGVHVVDTDVHQATYPLRSGQYRVAWRAISADGHPVQGTFRFTVALAPGDEPTELPPATTSSALAVAVAGPASTQDPSGAWWPWLAVGAGALVVVATGVALLGRRTR